MPVSNDNIIKGVLMVACITAATCAHAYDSSYDAIYTAETGYVTLNGSDSGNGENSSFHTAKNWSDKDVPPNYGVPHAGTNYYVKAAKTLYLDHVASGEAPTGFAGDSIVVGGQVLMNGAYGTKAICGPLTMLPDSQFYWVNIGNIIGGSIHVKGTGLSTVKPVLFRSGRLNETNLRTMSALMSFSADADGELHWVLYDSNAIGVTFVVPDDWSGFLGTFKIGRNFTFKTQGGLYQMPGHVIITTNAMLQLTAEAGQSTIGALTVQNNGVVNLSAMNGAQTVKITKKLELEPGALVVPRSFSGNHLPAREFHPIFELSSDAVLAGLPDFSSIPVPMSGRTQSIENGHTSTPTIFPEMEWVVRDAEGGCKVVGFSYKETVAMTNNMVYAKHGFNPSGSGDCDPAKYWSDGEYPQKGKGYYSSFNLVVRQAGNPYVFPGDSLAVNGAQVMWYSDCRDMTVTNLIICGNGRFRTMNKDATYHLRGAIKTMRSNNAAASFRFMIGDRSAQIIDSDISGDGLLRFAMDTEVSSSAWDKTLPCGIVELAGDNSAYRGKMIVECWQSADPKYDAYFGGEPFSPGPYSNITLRVSSQANLGGALPEVAYDALTISNECRLALLSTATFDELSRGWFFPEKAYLKVEDGAVATVTCPITYGTKLVKEGDGALMLGGTASVASGVVGRPQLKVEQGELGFVSSAAIVGLDVAFSAGTSMRIQAVQADARLAARGVDLTDASISSDSAIPIVLDMTGVEEGARRISVAVCTIPESSVADYSNLFAFDNEVRGYAQRVTWEPNSDSTKTLRLTLGKQGFVILVR